MIGDVLIGVVVGGGCAVMVWGAYNLAEISFERTVRRIAQEVVDEEARFNEFVGRAIPAPKTKLEDE